MIVKIYIRPLGDEFMVEAVENDVLHQAYALADYSKAIIKTAVLVMEYRAKGIQPQIFNELRTHVQVN